VIGVALLCFACGTGSRPSHATHPAGRRTKPSSGAQRRQTLKGTGADLKRRFKALGHQNIRPGGAKKKAQ
jgi:hypothetical protein